MKPKLSEKDISAIEKALQKGGKTEANIKVENGQIVVLQIDKKKIN